MFVQWNATVGQYFSQTYRYINYDNSEVDGERVLSSVPGLYYSCGSYGNPYVTIYGTPTSAGTYRLEVTYADFDIEDYVTDDIVVIVSNPPQYTHTIYYDANGGSGSMNPTVVTDYNSGSTNVTLAGNGFTPPAGHYFSYWWMDNGEPKNPGDVISIVGNTSWTAYAIWDTYKYTVTWKNWDGTVLETDNNVPYGTTPTYNGATPTRASTAQYTYTFTGWSPTVGAITGDTTYTAQFSSTVRSYTVTLTSNGNGTVSGGGTYTYGSTANISATPNSGYKFVQWSDGDTNASRSFTVTGDVTLSATFAIAIAKTNVKVNGSWVKGSVYVNVNGTWTESKKIYVKVNGVWEESTG